MRRAIWLMSDEDAKTLFEIAKRHIQLVKEYGKADTLLERKQTILNEIEVLRQQRDFIINQYQKN